MQAEKKELILARLEGLFRAFEWLNTRSDNVCTYRVFRIPMRIDPASDLASHFKCPAESFRLLPVVNWEEHLRSEFRYLFIEVERGKNDGGSLPTASLIDEVLAELRLLWVIRVWEVDTGDCLELREGNYRSNTLLELKDNYQLIHLGGSD